MDSFIVLGQIPGTHHILTFNEIVFGTLGFGLLCLGISMLRSLRAQAKKINQDVEPQTTAMTVNSKVIVYSELNKKLAKNLGYISISP
jgi:hypothetical protein